MHITLREHHSRRAFLFSLLLFQNRKRDRFLQSFMKYCKLGICLD